MIPIIKDISTVIKNIIKHKFCYFIGHKWSHWEHYNKFATYVRRCVRCKRKNQRNFKAKNEW